MAVYHLFAFYFTATNNFNARFKFKQIKVMRSTFKVLYYVKHKNEKRGLVPIMGRITVNGTIAQFSCKLTVRTTLWDAKANRAAGKSLEARLTNEKLDHIKSQIHKQYQSICDHDSFVTAEKVKNAYLGFGSDFKTVIELLDEHLAELKKRIGRDAAQSTFDNYTYYRNYIADFIRFKLDLSDIPIRELESSFIENFVSYLTGERGLSSGTIIGAVIRLKWVTGTAHSKGWIKIDPFEKYKYHPDYKERQFLYEEDLSVLMKAEFSSPAQERIRDIFIFCCFTGLAYIDVKNLTYDDLRSVREGDLWIEKKRSKTGTPFAVKLLPVAKDLVEKYRGATDGEYVFPVNDRRSMNASLKKIAKKCGIKANLSMHIGRHSFATTVTLSQGVPLETVSKMLGHKQITTTQIYAKITKNKIETDMNALQAKLDGRFVMV